MVRPTRRESKARIIAEKRPTSTSCSLPNVAPEARIGALGSSELSRYERSHACRALAIVWGCGEKDR